MESGETGGCNLQQIFSKRAYHASQPLDSASSVPARSRSIAPRQRSASLNVDGGSFTKCTAHIRVRRWPRRGVGSPRHNGWRPGETALSKSDAIGLDGVVLCSDGLHVAQRGSEHPRHTAALWVRNVGPVARPDTQPVQARRTDGVVWRRHWVDDDRLVIEFVDLVTIEVREAGGDVIFDRPLPAELEQHLLFDHVVPLVLARRGQLVLHGGVISRDEKGVVLVGASGTGKSTLTAFTSQHGWTVGGDDGAVLSMSDPPTVQPTYATVRLTPVSAALLGMNPAEASSVVGKLRLWRTADRPFNPGAVPLRLIAIIVPADAGAEVRFERLDGMSAHAKLFGSTFHAELSAARFLPAIVDRLASIVETTPVGSLIVPRGLDGLAAAEKVLRTEIEQMP